MMKRLFIASLSSMVFTCLFFINIAVADDLIYGCKHKQNGKLRIVQNSGECNNSEILISWNKQGFQGEQGIQGEQGPQGEKGEPGSNNFTITHFQLNGKANGSYTIPLTSDPSFCSLSLMHINDVYTITPEGNGVLLAEGSSCDVYYAGGNWYMDSHSGEVGDDIWRVTTCTAACLQWE